MFTKLLIKTNINNNNNNVYIDQGICTDRIIIITTTTVYKMSSRPFIAGIEQMCDHQFTTLGMPAATHTPYSPSICTDLVGCQPRDGKEGSKAEEDLILVVKYGGHSQVADEDGQALHEGRRHTHSVAGKEMGRALHERKHMQPSGGRAGGMVAQFSVGSMPRGVCPLSRL